MTDIQLPLLGPSKNPLLILDEEHHLVRLTHALDWEALIAEVEEVRRSKLKSRAGRPPHLRPLAGAVVLMAVRQMPYRELEDQIRHYGPARYLCGLSDSQWTPDFTTIQDFMQLMGPDGLKALNRFVVQMAQQQGFSDPSILIGDTTAQEAPMKYPTEVGLLGRFLDRAKALAKDAGTKVSEAFSEIEGRLKEAKDALFKHRFHASSKDERLGLTRKALRGAKTIARKLKGALGARKRRAKGKIKTASQRLETLLENAMQLFPQIAYWLKHNRVAKNKIVNLSKPLVRAIPRGKVGKDVEFGLKWGIQQCGAGFVMGTCDPERGNFSDHHHVKDALQEHEDVYAEVPNAVAYDRGGYSHTGVRHLQKKGVDHIAVAPTRGDPWLVSGKIKDDLIRKRSGIERCIGTLKTAKYGFNRPAARSEEMMMACGHRAMLGFNLTLLLRMQLAH